jgi:thiosulfate/3-mercaptopyruvate sulfurtransferase
MDSLVSTEWLSARLGQADLKVVDASWHLPASGRNGRDEYLAAHIPHALFLDIDKVADTSNPAPHAIPTAESFGAAMAVKIMLCRAAVIP